MTQMQRQPANDTPADLPTTEPTLADRVKAAQTRIADQAGPALDKAGDRLRDATDGAVRFVKDHPILAVTGAIVAGAAIAFALPGKPGRKMRGGAVALGGLAAELAATYGSRMLAMADDAAHASREKLSEIGGSFADVAADAGSAVADTARRASDAAAAQAHGVASKLRR